MKVVTSYDVVLWLYIRVIGIDVELTRTRTRTRSVGAVGFFSEVSF